MKISEIINETATGGSSSAGGIASLAKPMGTSIIKRSNPTSIFATTAAPKKKKKKKKIKETMDFNAGVEAKPMHFSPVTGGQSRYDLSNPPADDPWYHDSDPPLNPNFKPDEEMNVANANAHEIANMLGLNDAEDVHMPIDQFIAIATQWLKMHIGKRSAEEPPMIHRDPGYATMVKGGKREGYFNEQIMRMVRIAKIGKERAATHVWFA